MTLSPSLTAARAAYSAAYKVACATRNAAYDAADADLATHAADRDTAYAAAQVIFDAAIEAADDDYYDS